MEPDYIICVIREVLKTMLQHYAFTKPKWPQRFILTVTTTVSFMEVWLFTFVYQREQLMRLTGHHPFQNVTIKNPQI